MKTIKLYIPLFLCAIVLTGCSDKRTDDIVIDRGKISESFTDCIYSMREESNMKYRKWKEFSDSCYKNAMKSGIVNR